jgi:hypothetical protein
VRVMRNNNRVGISLATVPRHGLYHWASCHNSGPGKDEAALLGK